MSEIQEQISFITWFKKEYPDFTIFHIPNGSLRDLKTAAILKKMGVMAGIPDLFILEQKLFIEMKKSEKQKLTKHQKEIKNKILSAGYHFIEGYGSFDTKNKVIKFLSGLD